MKVLLVCDPGPDPDDVKVLLCAAALHRASSVLFELLGVVCNGGGDALGRARLAKAVLRLAGVPDVPVSAGSAGVARRARDYEYALPGWAGAAAAVEEEGSLLLRVLRNERHGPGSVSVVAQAALTDVAAAMAAEPALFCAKVRRLAVVGGLRRVGGGWEPDDSHNNLFDLPAATAAYAFCLARAVPLLVLGRAAVPLLPMELAERFAATGHPLLAYLCTAQRSGLVELWGKVQDSTRIRLRQQGGCAEAVGGGGGGDGGGDSGDGSSSAPLPARCGVPWYFATFCGVGEAAFAAGGWAARAEEEGFRIEGHLAGTVKPYDVAGFMALLQLQLAGEEVAADDSSRDAGNGGAPNFDFGFDFEAARIAPAVGGCASHFLLQEPVHAPREGAVAQFLSWAYEDVVAHSGAALGAPRAPRVANA
jgi:hypothetical protein